MSVRFPFSEAELRRYSRQMILPEVGGAGQARLRQARVLVIGAGGLGSPAALYLAAAGVGTLGLVDSDRVDLSNLQRQILHGTKALDLPKVASAQGRIEELNPDVHVVPHALRLDAENAREVIGPYDVVVEGSDNLRTKLAANDACVALGRPLVAAGILRWEGQLLVVRPGESACYRCVYRRAPPEGAVPTCEAAGILGPVAGVVGSLQAVEALKLCLGLPGAAAGRLLLYDGAVAELRAVTVRRDPACPACGTLPLKERAHG
ncbi:MAG TPA: HesA/MoeB/ThiF family protein [Methylomirabilota bacterium]|nr:HesA/MoeB/ThiF family protein [Methylomirabilota bacterium]